jgi:hypothetical protein
MSNYRYLAAYYPIYEYTDAAKEFSVLEQVCMDPPGWSCLDRRELDMPQGPRYVLTGRLLVDIIHNTEHLYGGADAPNFDAIERQHIPMQLEELFAEMFLHISREHWARIFRILLGKGSEWRRKPGRERVEALTIRDVMRYYNQAIVRRFGSRIIDREWVLENEIVRSLMDLDVRLGIGFDHPAARTYLAEMLTKREQIAGLFFEKLPLDVIQMLGGFILYESSVPGIVDDIRYEILQLRGLLRGVTVCGDVEVEQ